ncbi:Alpha-type protein kinase domain-containing protein [Mycena indigotica]|uniref:Alpha-type protein kinase domain-containing protein n=1 Tax=Mycena indigotica TaxID=2126181 RepID=A0A8H6SN93_9AGAR|nr:Alpha-type protein kinase domain-containing protein [Mycena indigotica]KAF7301927.1 Alpha-type protein kinase domain-containing protein [Mycena indigotica]
MPPLFAASFTADGDSTGPVRCARGKACRGSPGTAGVYPAGTQLQEMGVGDTNKVTMICAGCCDYYLGKPTTRRIEYQAEKQTAQGPVRRVAGRVPKGDAQIHRNIAAAQRHEKVEVRAIGNLAGSQSGPRVAYSNGSYTPSHSSYEATRNYNRNRAMAVHTTITGSITVRLVSLPPRAKTLQTFDTCQVSVGDVFVGIGAVDLLYTAFNAIKPAYQVAMENRGYENVALYPLTIDDVQMVNKNGVPFNMSLQQDIIRQHFYRPAKDGITLVFNNSAKPAVVQLQLTPKWCAGLRRWENDIEEEEMRLEEGKDVGVKRKSVASTSKARKRVEVRSREGDINSIAESSRGEGSSRGQGPVSLLRTATMGLPSLSDNRNSVAESSPYGAQSRLVQSAPSIAVIRSSDVAAPRSVPSVMGESALVTPSELARALSMAKKHQPEEARAFVQVRTFTVTLYKIKLIALGPLIRLMLARTRFDMYDTPHIFHLTVDSSISSAGGFKTAYFGTIQPSPFASKQHAICAKQAHKEEGNILPSQRQLELLPDELMTLQWANALMSSTYELIAAVKERKLLEKPTWKPKIKVPDLCFTEAGLAIEQGQSNRAKVYMIEEHIQGEFRKYLHNGSAKLTGTSKGDPVALFLSFSQHAQYINSNGLAFVSDYQGGPLHSGSDTVLLTDPQLLTHPDLGAIFAGGNVTASFLRFPQEHVCNSFCLDFELTPLAEFVPIPTSA